MTLQGNHFGRTHRVARRALNFDVYAVSYAMWSHGHCDKCSTLARANLHTHAHARTRTHTRMRRAHTHIDTNIHEHTHTPSLAVSRAVFFTYTRTQALALSFFPPSWPLLLARFLTDAYKHVSLLTDPLLTDPHTHTTPIRLPLSPTLTKSHTLAPSLPPCHAFPCR